MLDRLCSAPSDAIKSLQISLSEFYESDLSALRDLFQGNAPNLRRVEFCGIITSWTSPIFDHLNTLFLAYIPQTALLSFVEFVEVLSRSGDTLEDFGSRRTRFLSEKGSWESSVNGRACWSIATTSPVQYVWRGGGLQGIRERRQDAVVEALSHIPLPRNNSRLRSRRFPHLPLDFKLDSNCSKLELKVDRLSIETRERPPTASGGGLQQLRWYDNKLGANVPNYSAIGYINCFLSFPSSAIREQQKRRKYINCCPVSPT